jgi:hypothetical protein
LPHTGGWKSRGGTKECYARMVTVAINDPSN